MGLLIVLFLTLFTANAVEPKSCVFCEIAAERSPASLIYRDANLLAFMTIRPGNPGHTLIVPVKHAENLFDLPTETAKDMMALGQRIAAAIRKTDLKCDAIQLRMNNGQMVQSVMHAHLHVIPRYVGDPGVRADADLPRPPRAELDEIAAKIRKALEAEAKPSK
jgi:histidine triad (HIT) family protein